MSREQSLTAKTGRKNRIIAITIIFVLLILSAILFLCTMFHTYEPPKIASEQIEGIPKPDEGFLYDNIQSEFGYTFGIAVNLYQQEDGSVYIYLFNPENSSLYMNCEIIDSDTGEVLYKSNVVESGHYIEKIEKNSKVKNMVYNVEVKVHAYEMETWYSAGTTTMEMILQQW